MGVDLDPAGTRALVAVLHDPDSAAYESVVLAVLGGQPMGGHERGFRFRRRTVECFQETTPRASRCPASSHTVSNHAASTAVLTHRGHVMRRPITDGVAAGAFWDLSQPAALPTLLPYAVGSPTVTLEFIPERLDQELPRIERYE